MIRCRCLLSLMLIVTARFASAEDDCQRLLATGNPDYPPYLWRDPADDQQLIGVNADLLRHLGETLGLTVEVIHTGPWSRAQEEARSGRVDVLAGYFITEARQQEMDFIQPSFLSTSSVVWVRKADPITYREWDDLKGHRGGTLVNNSHGQRFDQYAQAHLTLEAVPNARQAFEKLLLKRNDYLIFERFPGMALARQLGLHEQLQVLDPPISTEGLYLALSRQSVCNRPEWRKRLQDALQQMVDNKLPERLLKRNLELWRDQQRAQAQP